MFGDLEPSLTLYNPVDVGFNMRPEAGHVTPGRAFKDLLNVLVSNHFDCLVENEVNEVGLVIKALRLVAK